MAPALFLLSFFCPF
uniref:Uncharacterized protein n=1 Tax=Arundo donax TaxID=35708 RepID=A0A0A9GUF4_ARUDO